MLKSRIINAKLGNYTTRRSVHKGTPQGGVLSPLLWNLVVNLLLVNLEHEGIKVVAYADDVAIAISGKHPQTLVDILQNALNKLDRWAVKCGLNINPHKTELVLFTRKYKIPELHPPTIKGVKLNFSSEAKYLGLILDKKLNWKSNIRERVNKATVALFSCKKAIGHKWGLSPKIMHWLYTAVVRPILTYGVIVWWTALDKSTYLDKLSKVQRTACLCISGGLNTTPSAALNIMLNLLPLDITSKQIAASTALRLIATSQWTNNNTGHTKILNHFRSIPSRTDYTTPNITFDKKFKVSIPSRNSWESKELDFDDKSIEFFTDGSKTNNGVGGGVYSERLKTSLSFRFPDHCSVFQAEILAIKEVLSWLKKNVISTIDIRIFSDSQAALKALNSVSTYSITAQNCQSSLMEMSKQFNLHLCWVPGHRDIPGNCRADELARIGTTITILHENANIGIPLATCKLMLKQDAYRKTNILWENLNSCRIAKTIWPKINDGRTNDLISLSRLHISYITGVITGHCLIGRHAIRLGVAANEFCRSCMDEEEEETIEHLLCNCPALSNRRKIHLGAYFFEDISDLSNTSVRNIHRFVKSSNWFNQ